MNLNCAWKWPVWRPEHESDQGPRHVFTLIFPAVFLFYLADPVRQVLGESYSPAMRIGVVLTVAIYAALYLYVLWLSTIGPVRLRALVMAGMLGCVVVLAVLLGPSALTYSTYLIVSALLFGPRMLGLLLGVGLTAAVLIGTGLADGAPDWRDAAILAVLTLAMFAISGFMRSQAELRMARAEITTLAVADERARLARDLHDVLGHSLTTITVKAGLARRVLESAADRDRAVAEVHDVERLARQALTDIRATVSDYRKVSLPAEIAGARAALRAAGIDADLPFAVDDVPAELREPFGYVLREGVTNLIRHSGATRCRVRLGPTWIEITDNGIGNQSSMDEQSGHGLIGLAERMAQVGGRIEFGPLPSGGFRLYASVPERVRSAASAREES